MINLLYIGNKLSHKNSTVTTIDTLGKALEEEGYGVTYASSFNNKILRVLHMLWSVIRVRKSVDYVIIDTYSTLNFYYAYFVSQLCRVFKMRYVPILHGGNLPYRLQHTPHFSRAIFNHAYVNIAPSKYTKQSFERYNITNVSCIPNTIQIQNYKYHIQVIAPIKLLWVRSFSEIYNPKLAIDVFIQLQQKYPDVSLTMVGPEKDGSLLAMKLYAKSKGVEVNFTGKLSKAEWLALAPHHNIFINTTNFDNMPVSVIEAMALGVPVVSTQVGGMSFLITSGVDGILVPPNNVEAFVKAITVLKDDDNLLKRVVKNARVKAECYSWDVIKHNWLEILK